MGQRERKLSGLSPPLLGEDGHLGTKSRPFKKTWPPSTTPRCRLDAKSRILRLPTLPGSKAELVHFSCVTYTPCSS